MNQQQTDMQAFEAAVKSCWSEVPHFTRSSDADTTYEDQKLNTAWWAFLAGINHAERSGVVPRGCVAVHRTWLEGIRKTMKEYLK